MFVFASIQPKEKWNFFEVVEKFHSTLLCLLAAYILRKYREFSVWEPKQFSDSVSKTYTLLHTLSCSCTLIKLIPCFVAFSKRNKKRLLNPSVPPL